MTFWQDNLQAESVPAQPLSLGEQYRDWQRNKSANGASGSAMYDLPTLPEQRAAAAARMKQIYESDPGQYSGLESYMGKTPDKLARRPGESTESWRRRVKAVARALPGEEAAARLAEIDAADETDRPKDHEALRAQLQARPDGVGKGIFDLSPAQRAEAVAARSGSRGIPASPVQVRAAIAAREAAQRGQPPQRTEIPGSSSGAGWIGTDR